MTNGAADPAHKDVHQSSGWSDLWAGLAFVLLLLALSSITLSIIFGPKIAAMGAPKLLPIPHVSARSVSLQTLAAQGKAQEIATIYAPPGGDKLWASATSGQLERVSGVSLAQLLVWEPVVARLALTVVSAPPPQVVHVSAVWAINKKRLAHGGGGPWSWAGSLLFLTDGITILAFGLATVLADRTAPEEPLGADSAPERCGTAQA